ncbi:hypothetical protein [Actinomadura macrotermitis]|uniref:Uncharacterized protein n=1 Tax=Actinomadura macrotermitis TaxID=2585200 RepID=A0A7K0BT67_9ACTN|nr:hypothetical protein [Actinomadura macrotermitis]MQY04369.1 hypothetical protein [Actinomadura macrotermitis]
MSALFDRLVDDAALFPPRRASLRDALPEYRTALGHPVLGRFLCPASRVPELPDLLAPEDLLDLGIIADTGVEGLAKALDAVAAEPRVRLGGIEIAVPADADQARAAAVIIAHLPDEVPSFIEVRRSPGWHEALDRIAAARGLGAPVGAKLRTGGVTADAFPSVAEVAAFIAACAERGLTFKCTAGLHHAVRHTDPEDGFVHHGFLNVLLAAATGTDLAETLGRTDGAGLAADAAAALTDRGPFVAFGSCDIDAPRADLAALGLIPGPGVGED